MRKRAAAFMAAPFRDTLASAVGRDIRRSRLRVNGAATRRERRTRVCEAEDLVAREPAVAGRLAEALARFRPAAPGIGHEPPPLTDPELERLRSLGYLGP